MVTIGTVVFLAGLVWLLQGISVLPGTFMSGSQFWAVVGAFLVLVGWVLVAMGLRRREKI